MSAQPNTYSPPPGRIDPTTGQMTTSIKPLLAMVLIPSAVNDAVINVSFASNPVFATNGGPLLIIASNTAAKGTSPVTLTVRHQIRAEDTASQRWSLDDSTLNAVDAQAGHRLTLPTSTGVILPGTPATQGSRNYKAGRYLYNASLVSGSVNTGDRFNVFIAELL